jgi:peptidoglycan/LPS O-acetylase OafA/YrhL
MAQSGTAQGAGSADTVPLASQPASTLDVRIAGLDGLRGFMTLMVVISHYFAELPHGISAFGFGFFGVIGFFALSGFLIGRLILEKKEHKNFLTVFYVRRFCRMIPPFFVVLAIILGLYALFGHHHWSDVDVAFPWWSYVLFIQNFFMVSANSIGGHWLAPTWTLAVEEHFYLIVPAALLLTPRRHLLKGLIAVGIASLAFRIGVFGLGLAPNVTGRVLLPAIADTLVCGLIAAVLFKTEGIRWEKYDFLLRIIPLVTFAATAVIVFLENGNGPVFPTIGTTLLGIGASALILCIVRDLPEAQRFKSPVLCFFGHTSYCVYLTHLAVLGLMHGGILGTRPDIATLPQLLVTLVALPVAVLTGWVFYKIIEVPSMNFGRRWTWSKERRGDAPAGGTAGGDVSMAPA